MRISFKKVFEVNEDAVITKHIVDLGIVMGPGIRCGKITTCDGTDLMECIGNDLEVEIDELTGVYKVLGVYKKTTFNLPKPQLKKED